VGYAQDFKNRMNDVYARLNEQFENTPEETPYQTLLKETVRRSGAPFLPEANDNGTLRLPEAQLMGYGLYSEDEKDYAIKIFKSIDRTYENFASSGRLTNDEKRAIDNIQQLLKENYLNRYDRSSLVYKMAKEYFDGFKELQEGSKPDTYGQRSAAIPPMPAYGGMESGSETGTGKTPYRKLLEESDYKFRLQAEAEESGTFVLPGFELMGYGLYTEDEKDYALKIFRSIDRTYENFASSGKLTNDEKRAIDNIQTLLKENYLDRYDRSSLIYKMAKEYFNGYRMIREGNGFLSKAAYDPDNPESWELKLPGAELLDTSYDNIQPEFVSPGSELQLPSNGNADIVKRYSNIGMQGGVTGIPDSKTSGYLNRSLNQMLLGNYTDDITALGTLAQVGLGFTGIDFLTDVRDLYYDITHWDGSPRHALQTMLDIIAFLPIIGSLKNVDEVAALLKNVFNLSDTAAPAGKGALKGADDAAGAAAKGMGDVTEGAGDVFKSTPELENHIRYVDSSVSRSRGIGGAHNSEEFFKNDVLVKAVPSQDIPGVTYYQYNMPLLGKDGWPAGGYGSTIFEKTVYNPKILSESEYMRRGLEAASNSYKMNGLLGATWEGVDSQGVKWIGYGKNGVPTSFFPDVPKP